MSEWRGFTSGLRAALPIIVGYLPVAFAFGTVAIGQGFSETETTLLSALMFSGANQILFVSSLATNLSLPLITFLCCLLSMRHLLYGLVLRDVVSEKLWARLVFGYGLTDEVFATTLASNSTREARLAAAWLAAIAAAAWLSWVLGTFAGALFGFLLQTTSATISDAMNFALPALFVGLFMASASPGYIIPMMVSALTTTAIWVIGYPELAIPAGVVGILFYGGRHD